MRPRPMTSPDAQPTPAPELAGRRIGVLLAADGADQAQFTHLWMAIADAGGRPILVSPSEGEATTAVHLERGNPFDVDIPLRRLDPATLDGLVVPGGVVHADTLRSSLDAARVVRAMVAADRPVAAIGHAAWLLADAGVAAGRRVTSWPSVRQDLRGAGADWTDAEVVVDGPLITARHGADLDALCGALLAGVAATASAVPAAR